MKTLILISLLMISCSDFILEQRPGSDSETQIDSLPAGAVDISGDWIVVGADRIHANVYMFGVDTIVGRTIIGKLRIEHDTTIYRYAYRPDTLMLVRHDWSSKLIRPK